MSRVFSGVVLSGSFSASSTGMSVPDGSITGPKIANGAVTGPKIQDGSITGPKIANGAVTGLKVAQGSIGAEHLDVQLTYNVTGGNLTIGIE